MTPQPQKQLSFKEVLRDPRLRLLSAGQFVSMFGDMLAIFAIFSVVSFRMHGSPAAVAGVMIAYMLPMVFVSPLAGVYADRWSARATMIASDLIRAVLVVFLVFATQIWQIYAVLILLSCVSSFFMPSQTIAIRSIVPKEGLMAANAIMMQIMQLTQIGSPSVAGLLTVNLGENSCFWLDSLSFLVSAGIIFSMTIMREGEPPKSAGSLVANMTAGARFIFTHSTLAFTVIAMSAGLFAIRCYSALAAVYVRDILHLAQDRFGFLGTLVGVGMLAGTQVVHQLAKTRSKSHLMIAGLGGIAGGVLVLALTSNFYVAAVGTLLIGISVALVIISAQTMMQGQTPMDMMGRVTSSLMAVLSLAQVGGLILSGSVAQFVGVRNAYFMTAALLVIIAGVGLRVVNRRQAAAVA